MSKQKKERWLVVHLPNDPPLLAAIGKVTILHSRLDFFLRRTVKTLADLTVQEGDRALAYEGSRQLRDMIRKLANRRLGKESQATLKLRAILHECERVTDERNKLVHALWAREMDEQEARLVNASGELDAPTVEQLEKLAHEIDAVANQLNEARLHGFLFEALDANKGMKLVKHVNQDN